MRAGIAALLVMASGWATARAEGLALQSEGKVSDEFLYLFLHPQNEKNRFTFKPQLNYAEAAGVLRYNFYCSSFPLGPNPTAEDWARSESLFSLFTKESAEAQMAPRLIMMSHPGDGGLTEKSSIVWKDARSSFLSWTDPAVQQAAVVATRNIVEHYEASVYGPRIWGYYLGAQETSEWIPDGYRGHGPDYSVPSRTAFQEWLRHKYGEDRALQQAWGRKEAKFESAVIPPDTENRFPIARYPEDKGQVVTAFYKLPAEQNWVDYSEFVSDTNANSILALAAQVKASSRNKKSVIVFYGYVFDLPASICGHLKAGKLLRNSNIDLIGGPISYRPYSQRLAGGTGGMMGAFDSLPLHDKAFIAEDDLRTHMQPKEVVVPEWYWDSSNKDFKIPSDLTETTGILKRNLAYTAFHGGAIWWMDLYGGGWFSDPGIWEAWKGDFGKSLREIRRNRGEYAPTVAVIVDEESRLYEKFTSTFYELYPTARNAVMGAGVTSGYYYLEDYLAGKVPKTAATVFVNLWRLDVKRLALLDLQIKQRGGVIIWQYAPGYLNPEKGGVEGVRALTGIQVAVDEGKLGSIGVGPLADLPFGGLERISPRIVIQDAEATPLSRYAADQSMSGAMKVTNGIRHILLGDCNWTPELMHRLLSATNVPLVTSAPAVVQANDLAIYVYGLDSRELTIKAPVGKSFAEGGKEKTVKLQKNESLLLHLK